MVTNDADIEDGQLKAGNQDIRPVENVPFRGTVATFTDSDPNAQPDDYAAQIDWGDGTVTPPADARVVFDGTADFTWTPGGAYLAVGQKGGTPTLFEIGLDGTVTAFGAVDSHLYGGIAPGATLGPGGFTSFAIYAFSNSDSGLSTLNRLDFSTRPGYPSGDPGARLYRRPGLRLRE